MIAVRADVVRQLRALRCLLLRDFDPDVQRATIALAAISTEAFVDKAPAPQP